MGFVYYIAEINVNCWVTTSQYVCHHNNVASLHCMTHMIIAHTGLVLTLLRALYNLGNCKASTQKTKIKYFLKCQFGPLRDDR